MKVSFRGKGATPSGLPRSNPTSSEDQGCREPLVVDYSAIPDGCKVKWVGIGCRSDCSDQATDGYRAQYPGRDEPMSRGKDNVAPARFPNRVKDRTATTEIARDDARVTMGIERCDQLLERDGGSTLDPEERRRCPNWSGRKRRRGRRGHVTFRSPLQPQTHPILGHRLSVIVVLGAP